MKRIKVLPYKIESESAKLLARALHCKRIVPGGRYIPGEQTLVINWGCSQTHFTPIHMLNKPEAVRIAANKLLTFQRLKACGVSIPEFTTDKDTAGIWLEDDHRVFARQKLSGHSGEGIVVVESTDVLPNALLYTKYQRKDREYRVHVFEGKIIDVTEKRRRHDTEVHPYIRNHVSGWVFCRDNVSPSENTKRVAVEAVRSLSLDFGGVDVIERGDQAWCLEVNTAIGIEGSTVGKYVEAIKSAYTERRTSGTKTRRHY